MELVFFLKERKFRLVGVLMQKLREKYKTTDFIKSPSAMSLKFIVEFNLKLVQ